MNPAREKGQAEDRNGSQMKDSAPVDRKPSKVPKLTNKTEYTMGSVHKKQKHQIQSQEESEATRRRTISNKKRAQREEDADGSEKPWRTCQFSREQEPWHDRHEFIAYNALPQNKKNVALTKEAREASLVKAFQIS